MKVKLAVASVMLLFAAVALADQVPTENGILIIPNGSTITSESNVGYGTTLYFSFADGTGYEYGNSLVDVGGGTLTFTTPVSDVSFDWIGYLFSASDNVGDSFTALPQDPNSPVPSSGIADFSGTGITSIAFGSTDEVGGINSMTYKLDGTDPPPVPEPSSLLLLGIGVAVLIGRRVAFARRVRGRWSEL
jgi:PEP-CTERM motif